ncbi:glycoside hydrolase family 2 protein [Christiangramia forsetii]|uniref:Membrane or secreted glycosyl hydrolase, family 2 n=2 Tax=Christiangramia forsetii TaxID=411153 RepID=A0M252_CHRFK|nr:glycoside hydrolase family 2 TIM barrel-domain containing protein [Christiangramia forsetii]GGG40085.1 beta-galactosidase [Christiangramia forsetii]CAL66697.1 membrane or secreted glycosyl hydrolase, family 2 [Christiangramia forsetii KT0803]
MNTVKLSLLLLLISSHLYSQNSDLPEGFPKTDRSKININNGWKFHLGEVSGNPGKIEFNDVQWKEVSVPHTLQLVSYELDSIKESWVQEKYLRDFGWYRKNLVIDAAADEKVFIEFEGVHNATEIWVNGEQAGSFKINGYVPFHFDITKYVKPGQQNLIAIKADNSYDKSIAPDPHRTDYVKFGGLYRDVYLVKTNKLHVNFNWEDYNAGVHITTPTVNTNNGTVSIKTTVSNEYDVPQNTKIATRIINDKGYVIKNLENEVLIPANSTHTFYQTTGIDDDFHLWSPDTPYLYRVNSVIYNEEEPVDYVENRFGFRTFKLVEGKGFVLNGEPIFLIGVNRHQNFPNIGDAVPNALHYQEALQYKQAGMNIIRLAHYTQDDAFLDACDELGLLVYEEPSTWIEWGGEEWFSKLDRATRIMIRNHRNHPSIVFWGAGINHRGPVPQMQYVAKEEDPNRLTASASSPWNGVKNAGITDVHATMDYRRTEWPESDFNMVMEHGSSANAEVNQFHISRYKASKQNIAAIGWLGADYNHLQPDIIDSRWKRDFMTTYAVLSAYRVPKPVYYWYQSELVSKPIVHIADESVSNNGKIRVFSNAREVALYHNDSLISRQLPDNDPEKANLEHPSFTFHYNWKEGEIRAEGFIHGEKIGEHSRTKQAEPYEIEVKISDGGDQAFYSGGSDLRLAHAYVLDKNGEIVTSAENRINFEISGEGEFVDNGKIEANPALLYDGVASIYVRSTAAAGKIEVMASSEGLKPGKTSITTATFNPDEIARTAQPIYDFPVVKIDIGGEKQLVQHEWQAWTGNSNKELRFELKDFQDAKIKISGAGKINWFGDDASMLGDLSFMGTDGVYSEEGELQLEFSGLENGEYVLETYHHTRRGDAKMTNDIELEIKDAKGSFTKKADDHLVDYYQHDSTGEREPLSVKTIFNTNGDKEVIISFKNLEEGDIWLNGFILKKVN